MFGLLFLHMWEASDTSSKRLVMQYFHIYEKDMINCIYELRNEAEKNLTKK